MQTTYTKQFLSIRKGIVLLLLALLLTVSTSSYSQITTPKFETGTHFGGIKDTVKLPQFAQPGVSYGYGYGLYLDDTTHPIHIDHNTVDSNFYGPYTYTGSNGARSFTSYRGIGYNPIKPCMSPWFIGQENGIYLDGRTQKAGTCDSSLYPIISYDNSINYTWYDSIAATFYSIMKLRHVLPGTKNDRYFGDVINDILTNQLSMIKNLNERIDDLQYQVETLTAIQQQRVAKPLPRSKRNLTVPVAHKK